MRIYTASSAAPRANGREAMEALRGKARKFASHNLPRAASATENAGKAVADFALSGSRSLAKSMRSRGKALDDSSVLASATGLLHSAGRFVRRNPALVVTGGAAIALMTYLAWRARTPSQDEPELDLSI